MTTDAAAPEPGDHPSRNHIFAHFRGCLRRKNNVDIRPSAQCEKHPPRQRKKARALISRPLMLFMLTFGPSSTVTRSVFLMALGTRLRLPGGGPEDIRGIAGPSTSRSPFKSANHRQHSLR